MWIAVSLRSVCWVRTLSLQGRQKVRVVACSHQVDVFVLCNTISSVRILSHFVKCGHCLLLLQIFTSGLFPLQLGRGSLLCNPGLSINCPSFCASMHSWHLPHPAMVGTLAPVVSTTTPEQFLNTPHLALPPLHLASATTILAQPAHSLQVCPSSELAQLPQVTLRQAARGPMALRLCP